MSMIAELHVAALEELHLVTDGRTFCGVDVDSDDLYADGSALWMWNEPALARCAGCLSALTAATPAERVGAIA